MSDLPIWALDRAREFQGKMCRCPEKRVQDAVDCPDCLAALLVDVAAVGEMVRAENAEYLSTLRADVLVEVRGVVEGASHAFDRRNRCANGCNCSGEVDAANEILARLKNL